jgi:hypothetical protein
MVRCKNCGWENPNENASCEKCGTTLSDYTDDRPKFKNTPTETFNVRKTAVGCPKCGYPIRSTDERCPNCNAIVEHSAIKEIEPKNQPIAKFGGTVIASSATTDGVPVEGRRLVALLVSYSIHPQGDYFPVFEGKNFIGRGVAANISVKNDSKMSEKHLSILYRSVDNKFKFKDEQSSNGTFINGKLADEGELNNGDVITSGSTQFLFLAIPKF